MTIRNTLAAGLFACSLPATASAQAEPLNCTETASVAELEAQMVEKLQKARGHIDDDGEPGDGNFLITNPSFNLMLESDSGHEFTHNVHTFTSDKGYSGASVSKMVTVALILSLVDEELMRIDDKPYYSEVERAAAGLAKLPGDLGQVWQKAMDDLLNRWVFGLPKGYEYTWPDGRDEAGKTVHVRGAEDVNLWDLLTMTSGLSFVGVPCLYSNLVYNGPTAMEECVMDLPYWAAVPTIQNKNTLSGGNPKGPGQKFEYGSTHMQIAALMAIKALTAEEPKNRTNEEIAEGLTEQWTWTEVFERFKKKYDVFPNSAYELPTEYSPVVAAGMHITTEDYLDFLSKLRHGDVLEPGSLARMTLDNIHRLNDSRANTNYPLPGPDLITPLDSVVSPEGYGGGVWIEKLDEECTTDEDPCPPDALTRRVHSGGALGTYPFMDFKNGYVGVMGRVGVVDLATTVFTDSGAFKKTYKIYKILRDLPDRWACAANKLAAVNSHEPYETLMSDRVTFRWTHVPGVYGYAIQIGASHGGSELGGTYVLGGGELEWEATGLPIDGSAVHVTVTAIFFDGAAASFERTHSEYTATKPAKVTSHIAGETLTSDRVTFGWDAGPGAVSYFVIVGSSKDRADLGGQYLPGDTLEWEATGLPTDGSPVHVKLRTSFADRSYVDTYSEYVGLTAQ